MIAVVGPYMATLMFAVIGFALGAAYCRGCEHCREQGRAESRVSHPLICELEHEQLRVAHGRCSYPAECADCRQLRQVWANLP